MSVKRVNLRRLPKKELTPITITFPGAPPEECLTIWSDVGQFTAQKEIELREVESESRPVGMMVEFFLAVVQKWDAQIPTPETEDLEDDKQVMMDAPLTREFLSTLEASHLNFLLNSITEKLHNPELPASMTT